MSKKIILAAVLILSLLLAACGAQPDSGAQTSAAPQTTAVPTQKQEHTVTVTNTAGMPLWNIGVYVYEDESLSELVWQGNTDTAGNMKFTNYPSTSYVAVLQGLADGYTPETCYPLTGLLSQIVVASQVRQVEDLSQLEQVKEGSILCDFSYTDLEGNTVTLSQLLEKKGTVMLNFWYVACQPCGQEFPVLDEFYEQYADQVALVALSPMDTAQQVAAYQTEKGLSLPMGTCDPAVAAIFGNISYPTTVVINADGVVTSLHTGSVSDVQTFVQMLETALDA